ncbi:hypothetical protein DFJ77DRAFT_449165 [Powellomyces hirtus]|nr:hypothetical protein DFJ77DRAFT_449165 [Powellomyces hirtus]
MSILDFINRHREMKKVAKYTSRRKDATTHHSNGSAVKLPKLKVNQTNWDEQRHAQEYYSYSPPSRPRGTSTTSSSAASAAGSSRCGSFRSATSSDCTTTSSSTQREGILITLADQDLPVPPSPTVSEFDGPAPGSPRPHPPPKQLWTHFDNKSCMSFDSPRAVDPYPATLSRSNASSANKFSPWWKKNKSMHHLDCNNVRSSEDYNSLSRVAYHDSTY